MKIDEKIKSVFNNNFKKTHDETLQCSSYNHFVQHNEMDGYLQYFITNNLSVPVRIIHEPIIAQTNEYIEASD